MNATATTATPHNRKSLSDFNDAAREYGPELVKQRIESALHTATAQGMDVDGVIDAAATVAADTAAAVVDASKGRGRPKKPRTATSDGGFFRLNDKGVWFHGVDAEGEPTKPQWVCASLVIEAKTRNGNNEEWGRLLVWKDADGAQHRWAAPMQLMIGEGRDMARELGGRGLEIAPGSKAIQRLQNYVITEPTEARARCVQEPGWHGGQYVLPTGEAIGKSAEHVVFQHSGGVAIYYGSAGDWKATIAPQCVGNSRMVFAVSAMFAGPLLRLAGIGGGGFHFIGDSSSGKSTILHVAASVIGPEKYAREWRQTANSLEGTAVLHNDSTMILDEIVQVEAAQASEAVYMLANGNGKGRANRNGDARTVVNWRLQLLSAGEITLTQHLEQAGKRIRAGQLVRLADIPADAGAGFGVFENLHGAEKSASFSERLKLLCAQHYGTPWRPWLDYLTARLGNGMDAHIRDGVEAFKRDFVPSNADGQVSRVAARFGLTAIAGELATMAGLTGWPKGEARRAALVCFRDWMALRGGTENGEHIALLAQVRAFFEAHGGSRFIQSHVKNPPPVNNRAGFTRLNASNETEYLVLTQAFKSELCKGYDHRSAIKWLIAAGWLKPAGAGRSAHCIRIPAFGTVARVYVLAASAIHGEEIAIPQSEA